MMKRHIVYIGDAIGYSELLRSALIEHYPDYEYDNDLRTRISVVVPNVRFAHDFVFEYHELFNNSYWRIVNLSGDVSTVKLHRPQYEGLRKDFVDVEWEFIVGYMSNPLLLTKLERWAKDSRQNVTIYVSYDDTGRGQSVADKLRRRLPSFADIKVIDPHDDVSAQQAEWLELAKYLHYFYQASCDLKHVPTELPEDEVDKAWNAIEDEKMKMSNIYNVMSIPTKMKLLGHDRSDWDTFYALTAEEIDRLTAVEHNRWCVERLIQGVRPCTYSERAKIREDMQRRLSDKNYAAANPISLKKRYKNERNAHYDLCASSELGVDETGLPVVRYDRDLTAAIPLIVKAYNDHHKNG